MPSDVVSLKRRNKNVTFYVGSDNDWEGRLFCFERGPHSLVIQTPELKLPGYESFADPEADRQYISTCEFDLQRISTIVNSFVFGQTNWAYLVTRKDGSYRLHFKEKPMLPISSPAWAPLIPETELIYTKYIFAEEREAIWNGRIVDCFVGWNDRWRDMVDHAMKGHRLLKGLDVTFEVLGHIVRDGEIIGLMTHAVDDRPVEYKDRAAMYAAVTKVQSKGLIISFNGSSDVSMHNGKVRFLVPQAVRKFSEVDDPEATADIFHWQTLSKLFEKLRQEPSSVPLLRYFQSDAVPFIPVPQPEKLLITVPDFLFRLVVHITLPMQKDGALTSEKARPKPSTNKHGGLILRTSRSRHYIAARPYTHQRLLLTAPE
ncbi:hypothetical protein B0H17DRAFT_306877 [Mycena rosella]|uniref:Uncharacterized protein n=1 Tax=Mycena rosella TaxID=1033263 RepID=A0AAD7DVM2_MYCRO|nr:hypothetical protein B0H17DRAFT_306877 [Mycena rosella]